MIERSLGVVSCTSSINTFLKILLKESFLFSQFFLNKIRDMVSSERIQYSLTFSSWNHQSLKGCKVLEVCSSRDIYAAGFIRLFQNESFFSIIHNQIVFPFWSEISSFQFHLFIFSWSIHRQKCFQLFRPGETKCH
jgi:hypothetical protein